MSHKSGLTLTRGHLTDQVIDELSPYSLLEYTDVTAEAAAILAEQVVDLHLNGLSNLSVDAAHALARHRGLILSLNGLADIDVEVAAALGEYRGHLILDGLQVLTPQLAEAFARHEGGLSLNGVTHIDANAAVHLSHQTFVLSLDGLTLLTPEVATHLLDKQEERADAHADNLQQVVNAVLGDYTLSLSGLANLTPELARVLAQHNGMLILNGLTTLSLEAARELQHYTGPLLALDGVERLDEEVHSVVREIRAMVCLALLEDESNVNDEMSDFERRRRRFIYGDDDVEQLGLGSTIDYPPV
jgi:hypothetical protein